VVCIAAIDVDTDTNMLANNEKTYLFLAASSEKGI